MKRCKKILSPSPHTTNNHFFFTRMNLKNVKIKKPLLKDIGNRNTRLREFRKTSWFLSRSEKSWSLYSFIYKASMNALSISLHFSVVATHWECFKIILNHRKKKVCAASALDREKIIREDNLKLSPRLLLYLCVCSLLKKI